MRHSLRRANLQRVVVRDEHRVGEERTLAHSLDRHSRCDIADRICSLAVNWILRARENCLVKFHLARTVCRLRPDITHINQIASPQCILDIEVVLLCSAVLDGWVCALNEWCR